MPQSDGPTTAHAAAIAHCEHLVARRRSPLAIVAASLPAARRALFYPAYAAMRVIDDYVDDAFLALAPAARETRRGEALATLDRWHRDAEAASLGKLPAADGPDAVIFQALAATLGRSTLGAAPWHGLATAMRHDIEERTIETWANFRAYAEGAAVAPAAVFLYILGCDVAPGGSASAPFETPTDPARDLALFCYLVHILRDLAQDAQRAPQLLTIPTRLLAECGLDKPAVSTALAAGNTATVQPLASALLAAAKAHRSAVTAHLSPFAGHLDPGCAAILGRLVALYDGEYDRLDAMWRGPAMDRPEAPPNA